jgi:hypothetical protein
MKITNWEELKKILEKKEGFIYNDFGSFNNWNPKEFNKLHKVNCIHMDLLTSGSAEWTYYFNSLNEAESWLEINRKDDGYSNCKGCLNELEDIIQS